MSNQGHFLNWFFPGGSKNNIEECEWQYTEYLKSRQQLNEDNTANTKDSALASHPNSPCARIFRKGEPIYRCLSCGFDETCAFCHNCFQPEFHANHKVHITICLRENGGVCDCGDPEAWIEEFVCPYASSSDNTYFLTGEVPLDLANAVLGTMETLLDFIIDVMSQCDLQFEDIATITKEKIEMNTLNSTFDPQKYATTSSTFQDSNNGQYFLQVYNDQIRHYRDAVQRIHLASQKVKPFAEMITDQIQKHGRAKVISSGNLQLLLERQKILSATGLASCIRSHRDIFREQVCDEIVKWLGDLSESQVFKINTGIKDLFCRAFCEKWQNGLVQRVTNVTEDNLYKVGSLAQSLNIPKIDSQPLPPPVDQHWEFNSSKWDLPNEICQQCSYNNNLNDYTTPIHHGSRLQYLLYLDIRFSKSTRVLLHDIYSTSLITNLYHKNIISAQYVDIYPMVADQFLTLDREPELSVMCTLSTQLFTCPSNSTSIIRHGDITRILASIYGFLTTEAVQSPHAISMTSELSIKSLKNRRWGQIFFDISYILSRSRDPKAIITSNIIPMACDLLGLLQGKPGLKRETESHVEYESPDYTAFFHGIPVIYQFAEFIARALNGVDDERRELGKKAIQYVMSYLQRLSNEDETKTQGEVSFLHPLHSFLSWLIELSKFESTELTQILQEYEIDNIFTYPIKTLVLMSQIKTGFWVRNGFTVRAQLQLYRTTGLRESGYLRDLYLTQMYIASTDPEPTTLNILSQWQLDTWETYDNNTLPYMIEECLTFFIHVLTEDLNLAQLSEEQLLQRRIEREIIHTLCFGGMNYAKLCSHIPDHIVIEKRFDIILNQMTVFKPPKGENDVGVYYLKDEHLDCVNPYYFNYTTNIKDDAIKFIRERVHKKTGKLIGEVVVPAYTSKIKGYKIGNFSASMSFARFLKKVLNYVDENRESLLETCLHLIHILALEKNVEEGKFYERFVEVDEDGSSIAALVYELLSKEEYSSQHAKIRSILKVFADRHDLLDVLSGQDPQFDSSAIDSDYVDNSEDEFEKKKRIAKDRQAKLLAKFKKQQSSFLKNNNMDTSDVEMEDEELQHGWKFPEPHCLLCQNAAEDAGPFGLITYVAKSSEFRNIPFDDEYWFLRSFSDSVDLDGDENNSMLHNERKSPQWEKYMSEVKDKFVIGPGFNSNENVDSKLVSSSCGHGMHFQCYINFLNTNRSRMSQITRNTPENIDHKEFVCPLCKAINNMFIPILWSSNQRSLSKFLAPLPAATINPFYNLSIDSVHDKQWYNKFTKLSDNDIDTMSILNPLSREIICSGPTAQFTPQQHQFRQLLSNMFQILSFLTFPQVFKADSIFVLVNSIKAIEISLRGISSEGKLIISQLSNNCLINLRTLNEFRNTSVLMKIKNWIHTPNPRGDAYAKMLANIFSLSKGNGGISSSIIEADMFECLVNIIPLPSFGLSFHAILEVTFAAHLIQILNILAKELSTKRNWNYDLSDIPGLNAVPTNTAESAHLCFMRLATGEGIKTMNEAEKLGRVIYSLVVKAATPFLRRAAIYAFVQCADIDDIDFSLYPETEVEANRLSSFMNLKTISDYLEIFASNTATFESRMFDDFVNYIHLTSKSLTLSPLARKLEYPGLVKLVDLPDRLDRFFADYYYSDAHAQPHLRIEDPAVCLFCAAVVDAQKQARGAHEGQCTTHYLKECPHDVGVFLLPKDRTLLLLHKNGGSFYKAPYLDEHGEVADESRRGKTMYLMQKRYDAFIRGVWLSHNVPNYIVRNLESVLDPGGWETL
ncbi:E3 ubiquitin-protein ligase ubr1 [Spathaspora sp. JA1]|nr:E3 ubiquitin-protein ligase ubr1 [Spathaspora sp. JA1]